MHYKIGISVLAFAGSVLSSSIALAGSCSDPWVTAAVTKYLHRSPSGPGAPECNAQLYRGGHWKSQQELDAAVDAYWATHPYPKSVAAPPPAPTQPHLNLAPQAADFRVPASALGYPRGKAPAVGQQVTYNGKQYQVTNIVSDGGTGLVNTNGSNLTVVMKPISDKGSGLRR